VQSTHPPVQEDGDARKTDGRADVALGHPVACERRVRRALRTSPPHSDVDILVLVPEAAAAPAAPAPSFVPVQVTSDAETPVMEIVFSGGERLHVRAGAPPDLVRATLTALRSPC
jgi:hypothetical protein